MRRAPAHPPCAAFRLRGPPALAARLPPDYAASFTFFAAPRSIRRDVDPRNASAAVFRMLVAPRVMTVHQLTGSSAEKSRLRSAGTEPIAQLLDHSPRSFFGQRRLIDVRSSVEIGMPLRSDLLSSDFCIHRGESAERPRHAATRCSTFA